MKALDPQLQSRLDGGATTLCWCWRITNRAGLRLGFTDHDRDIAFDGTTFEAASGFTASEMKDAVGLSVDNLEVESALVSDRLSEAALSAGDFDDAHVEIFRVDWSDPNLRVLMRTGSIGEVRRTGTAFTAEIRGLAHYLQQPKGRVFQYGCDADLGDARCGIDLSLPVWRGTGTLVFAPSDRVLIAGGLDAFADGWFTRGLLTMKTGANAGRRSEVKRHTSIAGVVRIELWQPLGSLPVAGDVFTIAAGCDKQFTTCRARFANAVNYRGFPNMPGNDFLTAPPVASA